MFAGLKDFICTVYKRFTGQFTEFEHVLSKCRKRVTPPAVKAACCSLSGIAGYIPLLCHHSLPVVTLYVSRNKPGKEPETQHPLPWAGSL